MFTELPIQIPNFALLVVGSLAVVIAGARQLFQVSFRMHPAQRMAAEPELFGIVAQDDGFGEFSIFKQCAPQRAFGDDRHRCWIHFALQDAQLVQRTMQSLLTVETRCWIILQQFDGCFGQFAFAHVVYRRRVDQIFGILAAQQLQEVKARFAVACGKISKLIIADDSTVAVAVQMEAVKVFSFP